MRFSIRELLLVTTITALAIGWSLHAVRYAALAKQQEDTQAKLTRVLEIARDTAQLNIEINDAGGIHVSMPRDWPQSLADNVKPIPAPSPLPPPGVEYLHALKRRIEKRGFPPDDKLRQKVEAAYDRVHDLSVELHYMACKGGLGRDGRK